MTAAATTTAPATNDETVVLTPAEAGRAEPDAPAADPDAVLAADDDPDAPDERDAADEADETADETDEARADVRDATDDEADDATDETAEAAELAPEGMAEMLIGVPFCWHCWAPYARADSRSDCEQELCWQL